MKDPNRPRRHRPQPPADLPADTHMRTVTTAGTIMLKSVTYKVPVERAFQQVLVISGDDKITITDLHGEIIAEHTRPAPGITYVGNGRPRGPRPKNR